MAKTELLTTAEACQALGISRRTLNYWRQKGLKAYKRNDPKRSGKSPNLYKLSELQAFAVAHGRGGLTRVAESTKRRSAPRAAPPVPPAPPKEDGSPDFSEMPTDTLLQMQKNLETAEKVTFAAWAAVQGENQRALAQGLSPPYSMAETAVVQRTWHENVMRRKLIEKDLPKILRDKRRYVDVHDVSQLFTGAVSAMVAELDQVGSGVAALCVGKDAREIRLLVDEAVRRARSHVERVWRDMMRTR